MSNAFNSTKTFTITAKSIDGFEDNRYTGRYNGEVKVVRVDEITKGKCEGAIVIHMTSSRLKGAEIQDWFMPRKGAKQDVWEQTMINRFASALMSSGKTFKEDAQVTLSNITKAVKEQLPGKTVKISQFTKEGREFPNINYIFNNEKNEEEVEDELFTN